MARDPSSYHHGDLRRTLLAAACRHIEARGLEGLSLRALAREAGVSATAPYRHFESRQALLAGLAEEGFEELEAATRADPEVLATDPVAALLDAGLGYIGYARANPVKYHLMFGDVIGDFSAFATLEAAASSCYRCLETTLEAGLERGELVPAPLRELGGTLWAAVHGISGLVIAGERRPPWPADVLTGMPPLDAQQRVVAAPGVALVRLTRGLVVDPERLDACARRRGCLPVDRDGR